MLWNKRIVVVFLTWVIVEAETPNEWSPEVSIRMKSISQLAFSPSGDAIAFSVREAVTQGEKSEYLNQIWVVKLSKRKSPIQYTFGEKSSSGLHNRALQ